MAFVLKRITDDEEDYTPPMVFRTKIKIGSAPDNDIIISDPGILPLHCEIYPYANEHRIVGLHSAQILIDGSEPEQWPVALQDGSTLSFAAANYKFHILSEVMRRSWKASFSSTVSIILLALLLVFELILIIWLPYNLKNQKDATLATMKQDTYYYIDKLRGQTRDIDTKDNPEMKSVKNLLLGIEDDIAFYIRKYRDNMQWDETRVVYRDLHAIGNIVDSWNYLKGTYSEKLKLDPRVFVNSLTREYDPKEPPASSLLFDSNH
ncbi:MAG TPA: hypothetical protein DD381_03760 [Lentisphaeria bacterium]|nr:MAG: hypothetical protein A2X47_06870 [Lentisphaerae bacterium GWF2_38_69]HBM15448.1 hypothetical protein [Lentisphaeria bacterium]